MKFISILVVSTALTLLTVQSLPADQGFKVVSGDKRNLHDLCGRWFCGHTKREETSVVVQIETTSTDSKEITSAKIEGQTVHEQPSTISDKRDLHDICGRWFCGHTKIGSTSLRDSLRSLKRRSVILPNV
ncbi:hypothetical protein K7432_013233 [Basidiobolus ranarum]|uniref:Uncharacterized protein n=1 Tax=Basidiobolus ranarum TaxID=34480 RepID=A0ABR2WJI7_9FUNG